MSNQTTTSRQCSGGSCPTESPAARPAYRSAETDEGIELTVALPGTRKEGLDLTFRDRILTLRAQRQDSIPEGWTVRQEAPRPESYELRVRLHSSLDPAKTSAELKDGLLRLQIGKREEALPRKIEVQ